MVIGGGGGGVREGEPKLFPLHSPKELVRIGWKIVLWSEPVISQLIDG